MLQPTGSFKKRNTSKEGPHRLVCFPTKPLVICSSRQAADLKAGGKPKDKLARETQKQNSGIPYDGFVFLCGAGQRPLGSSLLSVVNRDVLATGVDSGFQNDYKPAAKNLAS